MFICEKCKKKYGGNNYLHNLKELLLFSIFTGKYVTCDRCGEKLTQTALSMILFYLPIVFMVLAMFFNFFRISRLWYIGVLILWAAVSPLLVRYKKYIDKYS